MRASAGTSPLTTQLTAYGESSIYRTIGEAALQHWRRHPLDAHVRWTGHLLCSSDPVTFAERAQAKFPTAKTTSESPTMLPEMLRNAMAFDEFSGCCDMRAAVGTVVDDIRSKVHYRQGVVTRITIDGAKASGVELADGTELQADLVIVAAGAGIVELLSDLAASGRVRLSGQVVGELDLRGDEIEHFARIPVRP